MYCLCIGEYGGAYLGSSGGVGDGYYSSSSSASYGGFGGGSDQQGYSDASFVNGGASEQQGYSNASLVSGGGYGTNSFEQQSSSLTTNYATDAQGLYQDPNPQIIRRPAQGGGQTFTQRVVVRFLQPPPVPPPGVCISYSSCITLLFFNY
jgi:hypothetical protein